MNYGFKRFLVKKLEKYKNVEHNTQRDVNKYYIWWLGKKVIFSLFKCVSLFTTEHLIVESYEAGTLIKFTGICE